MTMAVMWRVMVSACVICGQTIAQTPESRPAEPPALNDASMWLMLDSRVIQRSRNVRLALGTVEKDPGNPLFIEDRPWEPRFDNLYANVLYDEQERIYKCWYSPFIVDQAVTRTPAGKRASLPYLEALHGNEREMGICYAVSQNGLKWTKPSLGLIEFDGSTANNIVLRGVHGAGIWKDPSEPDPARRYKLLGKAGEGREPIGVAFSPDGLHWSSVIQCPEMQSAGDTHNNSFRDERLTSYVAITRLWDGRQRVVGRSVSPDFVKWSRAVDVLHGNPHRQTYAMPVCRYESLYLGLVMILDTRTDLVDCELACSTDGIRWDRVCEGRPLIPRGPKGSFDYGCVYAAACPVIRNNEIRLYYGGSDDTHGSWRKGGFGLARLRPGRFAAYEPADKGQDGSILTRPLKWTGGKLWVNTDAAGGVLRVEVLDESGASLGTSRSISTDEVDGTVEWDDPTLAPRLKNRIVQLKFEFKAAKLYAFGVRGS